ncbi:MAG: hypothetical protein GY950_00545, partial [bacterium]|nr:hypothetical protein [bacterium]
KTRRHITVSMTDNPIFFLIKGKYVPDSRNHEGLHHHLTTGKSEYSVNAGEPLSIEVRMENSGNALWLHQNINNIGVVNLGIHLLSGENRVINNDFSRFNLGKDVCPGEKPVKTISVKFEERGRFNLVFDMVSEYVCWFEENGSQPAAVTVNVI